MFSDKWICRMIIKLNFGAAGAGASAGAGSNPAAGLPSGASNAAAPGAVSVSVFGSNTDEPGGSNNGHNIIDSGIRNSSEFFPEAA